MQFLKKYWHLVLVSLLTIGLGVAAILTGQQLKTAQPVAPSVPQAQPQAVEPECKVEFTLTVPSETPTPSTSTTQTPTPSQSPTVTPTQTLTPSQSPTVTQTPTATPSVSITPTQPPGGSPTPTQPGTTQSPLAQVSPTPLPTPKVPVAGIGPNILGISIITLGGLLVLIGLAL